MKTTILKIFGRYVLRNKLYSIINLVGLSVGLASSILILRYIQFESSYDNFWTDHDRILRINSSFIAPEGESRYATAPPPLAPTLIREVPEIDHATRILKWSDFTLRPDTDSSNVFRETNVYIADKSFFKVFKDRLVKGDENTALSNPVSMVLSESAAKKYFGEGYDNDILDRNILGGGDGSTVWNITGIMKDIPVNSHMDFDIIISMSTFGGEFTDNPIWSWNIMHTYVLLNNNYNNSEGHGDLAAKLDQVAQNHALPNMASDANRPPNSNEGVAYYLQPLSSIHFSPNYLREMTPNGSITSVYIFAVVAILILLIACVNFTNLSTALALRRTREVGIRKVMGSGPSSIMIQFLMESVAFSFAALILSLGLVELVLLFVQDQLQLNIADGIINWQAWAIPLMVLVTGVVAGIYPSVVLAGFKPIQVLSGKDRTELSGGLFRKSLVVFQFAISIGLVICTGIISDQFELLTHKTLGLDKENVIIIQNDREIDERRGEFTAALGKYPEIISSGFCTGIPFMKQFMVRDFTVDERSDGVRWFQIDENFVETMKLSIVEGRNFKAGVASDSMGIILNQKAIFDLGITDPIGREIIINKGSEDERKVHIVGVVEDFHYESLHHDVKALGMEFLRGYDILDFIVVRTVGGKSTEAVDKVRSAWNEFEPNVPITYRFLDEDYDALYKAEQNMTLIFRLFAGMAILIAGMGLFGLAVLVARQRTKEIGIRKVLGASVSQLVMMLIHSFGVLALSGFIVASPVVLYAMNKWLSTFPFRVGISFWVFVEAAMIGLLVTVATISYQAIRVAKENPVQALKEE
jgi:putative ABC transport system permease protein